MEGAEELQHEHQNAFYNTYNQGQITPKSWSSKRRIILHDVICLQMQIDSTCIDSACLNVNIVDLFW